MEKKKNFNLITLVLVILLVVVAFLGGTFWIKSKNFKRDEGQNKDNGTVIIAPTSQPTPEISESELFQAWFKRFVITQDEICQENGKPIFYYFGASTCIHCKWEYPVLQAVTQNFQAQIVFRDNMDKLNKLESQDAEVLSKYSQINKNGIPFLILGCKYARVGSGEDYGSEKEEKFLIALTCKLTNNQPAKICATVKDLVEQVK